MSVFPSIASALRLCSRTILVGALCFAVGGQWAALQTVGWTTMLVKNVRTDSLAAAVAKTFDGQHPCDLCRLVQKGQHHEKKPEAQSVAGKLDMICAVGAAAIPPAYSPISFAVVTRSASAEAPIPLLPPPRSGLV